MQKVGAFMALNVDEGDMEKC